MPLHLAKNVGGCCRALALYDGNKKHHCKLNKTPHKNKTKPPFKGSRSSFLAPQPRVCISGWEGAPDSKFLRQSQHFFYPRAQGMGLSQHCS